MAKEKDEAVDLDDIQRRTLPAYQYAEWIIGEALKLKRVDAKDGEPVKLSKKFQKLATKMIANIVNAEVASGIGNESTKIKSLKKAWKQVDERDKKALAAASFTKLVASQPEGHFTLD